MQQLPAALRTLKSKIAPTLVGAAFILLMIITYAPAPMRTLSNQPPAPRPRPAPLITPGSHWPGWHGISHMIVFGDSYSSTGFRVAQDQPSKANPFGNPAYPGDTSCNGPNWIDFLTTTYNQSFIRTLNFAFGGATVDADIVRQYAPYVKSFKEQVNDLYLPNYSPPTANFDWFTDNTLVAIFFGINDINNAYQDSTASFILEKDIAQYAALLDDVYHTGARNFLFMNVPPFDRSPSIMQQGPTAMEEEAALIEAYNINITEVIANFRANYSDVTTFLFDNNQAYNDVLDNPCSQHETCPVQDVDSICDKYEKGTDDWYSFDPSCPLSVDKYFWFNKLHPTFRIHNVTAKLLAAQLSDGGDGV